MDELGGFEPTDTTGFIQIESIRIKKWVFRYYYPLGSYILNHIADRWAQANIRKGEAGVTARDVYKSRA